MAARIAPAHGGKSPGHRVQASSNRAGRSAGPDRPATVPKPQCRYGRRSLRTPIYAAGHRAIGKRLDRRPQLKFSSEALLLEFIEKLLRLLDLLFQRSKTILRARDISRGRELF